MKYFKVYANNVRVNDPVTEIPQDQVRAAITQLVNQVTKSEQFQNKSINWNDQEEVTNSVREVYDIALAVLEDRKILFCGDFCIMKQKNVPQQRPYKGGFDTELIMGRY